MPGINHAYRTNRRRLFIKIKGEAVYSQFPGVQSDDITVGEATTETLNTYDGTSQTTTALPGPGTVAFEALKNPLHPTFVDTNAAFRDGSVREFRLEDDGDGDLFVSTGTATVAIDADGVCTFAAGDGSVPDFAGQAYKPGMVIEVAGNHYAIKSISEDGSAVVAKRYGADHAAINASQNYKITFPDLRTDFAGTVTAAGAGSSSSGAVPTVGFTLAPSQGLPDPTII